jgi:hypothetical protein
MCFSSFLVPTESNLRSSAKEFGSTLLHLTLFSFHPHSPAMINVTPTQLREAADIQEKIQSLQEELGQILGGETITPAQTTEAPRKYKFSAASRAKMRAAQKARWAKIKGTAPAAKPAKKPKRKFSAAGRAALSAAAKARWAKAKKAGKSRL